MARGVTRAWVSPDSIVDMHRGEAKRVDGLKEEWKDEYERAGLVDKMKMKFRKGKRRKIVEGWDESGGEEEDKE